MPILLGVGTALLFLVETNMAVLVGALSLVTVVVAEGPRIIRLFSYLMSTVIAVSVFWIIDSQSVSNIGSYIHGSIQLTSGYTAALAVEDAPAWQYPAAVVMVMLVVWVIYVASPERTFRLTWAPMILVAIYLFLTFKEMFVVHGPAHKFIAFAACLVALLAVPVTADARRILIGTLIVGTVALIGVNGLSLTSSALKQGMGTSLGIPATVLSPARRAASMQTVRTQIHLNYYPGLALSPTTVSLARGKTTYIQDGQTGVSWAYPTLPWKPLPVLQDFMAFTPYLDQLNANFVASAQGPQRILRPPSLPNAFDGGVPAFQTPATVVSMICHYAQLGASPSWQVLGRIPDRCGPMQQISVVHSGIGQAMKVPKPTQPDEAIIATISSIPLPVTAAPSSVLFKTSSVTVQLNMKVGSNRFIAATAEQPHLMIEPQDLGYSCPFSYVPIHKFSISGGEATSAETGLTVTYYSMRVAPAGGTPTCSAAASRVAVSPRQKVTDNTVVRVTASGFPHHVRVAIVACNTDASVEDLTTCDNTRMVSASTSRKGSIRNAFVVKTGTIGNGTCAPGQTCYIKVTEVSNPANYAFGPIVLGAST